jgi:hypothetical protein
MAGDIAVGTMELHCTALHCTALHCTADNRGLGGHSAWRDLLPTRYQGCAAVYLHCVSCVLCNA